MIDPADVPTLTTIPAASPAEQAARDRQLAAQAAAARVAVRFGKECFVEDGMSYDGGYFPGETCGFPPDVAARLIAAGFGYEPGSGAARGLPKPPVTHYNGALVPEAAGTVAVEMIAEWGNLVPGDRAGFSPEVARMLEVKGFAKRTDVTVVRRTLAQLRDAILGR